MSEPSRISESDEADLAALADGRLEPARRDALEARLEAEPALADALARQRRGDRDAAAAGGISAPLALRERIEAMSARRSSPAGAACDGPACGSAFRRRSCRRGGGGRDRRARDGRPAVGRVDRRRRQRPPVAAVTLDPSQPRLLKDNVEQSDSPTTRRSSGGKRTTRWDKIDAATPARSTTRSMARTSRTDRGREQLSWRPGASRRARGTAAHVLRGRRTVVTWRREGRTCVMSAEDVPTSTLLELAAWKGLGAVRSDPRRELGAFALADGLRHPAAPTVQAAHDRARGHPHVSAASA